MSIHSAALTASAVARTPASSAPTGIIANPTALVAEVTRPSVPGHLGDQLIDVHAHHGIGLDQLLALGEHGMERDLLAPGLRPPAVAV